MIIIQDTIDMVLGWYIYTALTACNIHFMANKTLTDSVAGGGQSYNKNFRSKISPNVNLYSV